MYRVVHLSDLHYTTDRREQVRTLLETVAACNPDHLVISGDLTQDGRDVHARGLKNLLIQHGFDSGEKLTVVPGNHDMFGFIYRTFSEASALLTGISNLRTIAEVVGRLRCLWKRLKRFDEREYERELAQFRSQFSMAFDGTISVSGSRGGYPFVKLLPDNLAMIGVDTCFYLPKVYGLRRLLRHGKEVLRNHDITLLGENLSGSTGWVDLASLHSLLSVPEIRRRRKIVVLHHCLHPMSFLRSIHSEGTAKEMQLVNRTELVELLDAHRVDIILHGHLHTLQEYRLETGGRVLNSGEISRGEFFGIEFWRREMGVHVLKDGTTGFPVVEEPLPNI